MRRTKIICTLGPAVDGEDALRALLDAGMNVARLNFSHGSHEEHARRIEQVKRLRAETGIPCAIMLDTKGPEIRTGLLADGQSLVLRAGQTLILTTDESADGSGGRVFQSCAALGGSLSLGQRLLLDDGLIELTVTRFDGGDIECLVVNDGVLGQRKSINVPGAQLPLPAVTDQDRSDLLFGIQQGVDVVAASFVRDGAGVREIKRFLADNGGAGIAVIAKIEAAGALDNIHDIVREADGIMVARGDLGVEVPAYRVPYLQKEIIHLCNRESKPVITATQMLDSMIRNPRPTRAEVADVANAIYDGTDCVMLSGETAAGKYPVAAVRTMAEVAKETERYLEERKVYHDRGGVRNVNGATGFAAVEMADRVDAKCILCPTHSGRTARIVSNFRPRIPLYAMSPSEEAIRRTCFYWGVYAFKTTEQGSLSNTLYNALNVAKANKVVDPGDIVVITAGDPQTSPRQGDYTTSTNMAMVAQIQ